MLSTERTPGFRHLSMNRISRNEGSSILFNEKDAEERRDPEKECFMCRQANIYIKPIGMQQERRVARRHPPSLTRAQIEELGQKEKLTKKEARRLLQCYFPEIKHVKYFQLHKYHSCCYDQKHLNLCKNHITALQHEREHHSNDGFHKHKKDEDHYKEYERDDGYQNRVSFVRIKIEPTRGIPTRFLAPVALPESLANMLIKQVDRLENKRKLPTFEPPSETLNQSPYLPISRIDQPYDHGVSRVSNYFSDDDSGDENNGDDNYHDSDKDDGRFNIEDGGIRGYNGNIMNRSLMQYEKKFQTKQEKEMPSKTVINGDLVVEDLEDLNHLFINEEEPRKNNTSGEKLKKKKRKKGKKGKKSHPHRHPKSKLNHWEMLALDQSKKEVCGCRHHVRRLEANQVLYDWCRCKDHQHKELKEKQKVLPPISPAVKSEVLTPCPPVPKVEKKTIGINATEPTTTELALAYDPASVEYDIIQESLYYRTSSGRLVKPEITNSFTYDTLSSSTGFNQHKSLLSKTGVVYMTQNDQHQPLEQEGNPENKNRSSSIVSLNLSNPGSAYNSQTLFNDNISINKSGTDSVVRTYKVPAPPKTISEENRDDEDDYDLIERVSPKSITEGSIRTPLQSPMIPMSQQKSTKPTYINQRPTPNFERESSILANRRWFDQALGDQNLLPVHDGRYGLIAGTSTEEYIFNSRLNDNDYVEQATHKNKSSCTIS